VFLRHKEGHRVPVRVRAQAIRDDAGAIVGSAEFFEERSHRATEARRRGADDQEIPNDTPEILDQAEMRAAFADALEELAAAAEPFGVLCMVIDDADHLRHTYGWQAVRAIRTEAAQTLAGSLRPADKVGAWTGSRFAALVTCAESSGLLSCAERLKRLVGLTAIPWWGDRLSVTMSMGGTMAREGDTVESLMQRAEEALESSAAERADSILVV